LRSHVGRQQLGHLHLRLHGRRQQLGAASCHQQRTAGMVANLLRADCLLRAAWAAAAACLTKVCIVPSTAHTAGMVACLFSETQTAHRLAKRKWLLHSRCHNMPVQWPSLSYKPCV
jgi:hypothetical protein